MAEDDPMETVALPEQEGAVSQAESTRAERWRQRMEMVSGAMRWLAPRARPAAEQAAKIAVATGQFAGAAIKTGGTVIGAGVAGIGLVAVGGPAGATVAAVGAGIGASSWVGGWVAEKVGQGVGMGLDMTGVVTEKTLYVSDKLLQGIHSVLTKTQTEILLGDEGAAVFEHVMDIHKESREVVSDANYMELLKGMIAYACLQRAMRVDYSNKGFLSRIEDQDEDAVAIPKGAGAFKRDGFSSDEIEGEKELKEVLRQVELAHAVYGAIHNALVGDGTVQEVLGGNKAMTARYLQLQAEEDIIAAQWESHGPHSPVYILVADRAHGALVLSIRGTMSSGDVLTDLRCRAGSVRPTPDSEAEAVHLGMWETAVRLDAELGDLVEEALAGACAGLRLRLTGHSLGAGVATLLAVRWRPRFECLRCVAFAPPCTVSQRMAEAARESVTSVVLADDAVCRWSLGSTKDVLRAAAALGKEEGALERLVRITLLGGGGGGGGQQTMETAEGGEGGEGGGKGEAEETVGGVSPSRGAAPGSDDEVWCLSLSRTLDADMQHPKLYPAGKVLWLVRGSGEEPVRCVERGAEAFERLVFSRRMLSDHLIHNYEAALRSLLPRRDDDDTRAAGAS